MMIVEMLETRHTPEELLALPDNNNVELIDGQFVEKPMSVLSGMVEAIVLSRLTDYVMRHSLGFVGSATTGIRCFPHQPMRVRKPDVLFVRRDRFSSSHLREGFLSIAPDLVVEVTSTHDEVETMHEKIEEYLSAGVALVWIVDPMNRLAYIHRADGTISKLRENDHLDGETILPGFTCKLAELFPSVG